MDLKTLREEIDAIDNELVRLFCSRMNVAAKISEYKKEHDLPIYVPAREEEKLADVRQKSAKAMEHYTKVLYTTLFELSRGYQDQCGHPSQALSDEFQDTPIQTANVLMSVTGNTEKLFRLLARLYSLEIPVQSLKAEPIPGHEKELTVSCELIISPHSDQRVLLSGALNELCTQYRYRGSNAEVMP